MFIRVELREDDADIRRQPLEVTTFSFWVLMTTHDLCYPFLTCIFSFFGVTNLCRQYILEIQVLRSHFRSGVTPKLLLELGLLATMTKLNFPFLPLGHQHTTFYLLYFMLICKQNWKLQSQ